MQIKVGQVHLFSILVTGYGFLPRILNQLGPPKNCLKDFWAPFPILMEVSTHAYHLKLPSHQSSTFPSLNQSRHQQFQTGIKCLRLQSSLKKKRNGKSLKYCIPRSREEAYDILWNGKASVKTQKDLLGNQPKTSKNCPELPKDSHSLYPDQPGPNSSRT
ncbi:hypothetical protein O181_082798 [Austropuccinia psidii MF-1]|uniref:Uncharacterized protein n=1 Tax=Austropuccinia psidii MF-1 TaxID=1389203 RepID=A0A9Q3IIX9_9BASI|nr:hypothetical protein [Austropuccinia psidii MF-1]